MNCEKLINIKESIESMEVINQKEVLKILKDNKINISENNNGSFINLSNLDEEVLNQITSYIEYFNKQQKNLLFIEEEKINIKKEFYSSNKNNEKIKQKNKTKNKETVVDNI